ncbi:acyl-CoA dehydrogenase family protein [Amycolatopsis sp. H20-H5]|uniref:acyl-CoA dehydrogenase family protein n=1 Tax=Amycolatopsis sp. H20-H5 TaxID=3046309 RepID=UPI002DBA021A|nr:acyl-CoA dehydrogenase family protein [Amycolatopsis sp. H20-H5]MEC3978000.1 acyl-CoA dehydrogenase family protein [Amycolatopsis sp. H20-H5]
MIGPALRERALKAERAGRLSDETIADLDATGAFSIATPKEFGGFELPVTQLAEVITEVSKWDGSCGWVVWVGATTNWIPVGLDKRVIEEVCDQAWVGPRVSGTDHHPGTLGRARRVEDGWIVPGGTVAVCDQLPVDAVHEPRLHQRGKRT